MLRLKFKSLGLSLKCKIWKVSVSVSKLRPTNEKSQSWSQIWMSLETKFEYLPNLKTYFQLKNEVGACQPFLYHLSTTCLPIVYQLSTKCQPIVNQLSTSFQPLVNHLSNNCQPFVNHLSTSCQSLVNHLLTTCHTLVNHLLTPFQPLFNHFSTTC